MSTHAALAAEIGDPDATRTVIAIVALLCVLGLALIMLAFWLRRTTRPDPELLAPLELMGERSWRRADPVGQRRRLDEVRPAGAEPLTRARATPHVDEQFAAGPTSHGFDDLHDEHDDADAVEPVAVESAPGPAPEPRDGTPPGGVAHSDTSTESDAEGADAGAGDREGLDRGSPTPMATDRPWLEELPDGDLDPEVLARADAELDEELSGLAHRDVVGDDDDDLDDDRDDDGDDDRRDLIAADDELTTPDHAD